jgi:hypothetical protein
MDVQTTEKMLRALKPTLRSQQMAAAVLERFWTRRIAIVWDVMDVHRAANEREVALTNREAVNVLRLLLQNHNKQYWLRWEDLTDYIDEHVLGRKLTRIELRRFLENDILTIGRKRG